jgi:hypothetical protein
MAETYPATAAAIKTAALNATIATKSIEIPVYYRISEFVTLDVEPALTDSEFTDFDPAGGRIPGAIDRVLAAGATLSRPGGST